MKRTLLFVLVVAALAVPFVACGPKSAPATTPAPAPPPPPPPAAPPETLSLSVEATAPAPAPEPPPPPSDPCSDLRQALGAIRIPFDYDQFGLSAAGRAKADEMAAAIRASGLAGKVKVAVEGHCDQRGTNEYNLALSENRARTVRDYLAGSGAIDRSSGLKPWGEEKLLDPAENEEAYAKNRRVEVVVACPAP